MEDFYKVNEFDTHKYEIITNIGRITEKEKLLAAKQILLGLALLYVFTIISYLFRPIEDHKLLDICTTIFPPLATLILVSYFRENPN